MKNPYAKRQQESDDDSEEDADEPQKLKISPLAKLACSMIPAGNKMFKQHSLDLPAKINEIKIKWISSEYLVWNAMTEVLPMSCSGVILSNYRLQFD